MKSESGSHAVLLGSGLVAKTLALAAFTAAGLGTMSAALAQTAPPAGQNQGQARYSKREVEVQGVPQTALTKPQGPPQNKKPDGPISLDEFVGQRQDKIQKLNQVTIEKYQRLLRVTDDD